MNDPADDRSRGRGRGRLVLGVILLLVGSLIPVAVSAQTDQDAAEKAAKEIQAAREKANAAADAFFQAESDLDLLADDLVRLETQTEVLRAKVARLRRDVESVAISRFVSSGASGIPLLTGIQAPQDQVQSEVFVDVLTNSGSEALDEFDIAEKQLARSEVELAERQKDLEQQQVVFTQLQKAAEDEVVSLRATEEDRLQDEAVRIALDAQIAAERVKLEELFRREQEAASRAIPDPGVGLPPATTTTTTVLGQEDIPVDGVPDEVVPDGDGPDLGPIDGTTPESTLPPATVPPASTLPPNEGASGGTSGGRTGTGGIGSNPRPVDTGSGYLDNIICPMPGSAYGDTWGAPRSGGRRHEGVDMIAPRGIPIYAVTNGYVTFKQNRLGGNAVSLVGDNGTRYYYGHLDSYAGVSRQVFQGEVVGYNGDSGNAKFSTPHLHFEIHPNGGLAVNPYPSVRAAGC